MSKQQQKKSFQPDMLERRRKKIEIICQISFFALFSIEFSVFFWCFCVCVCVSIMYECHYLHEGETRLTDCRDSLMIIIIIAVFCSSSFIY